MIGAIVFSRDRACQLDLLLTSLSRNGAGLFDPISVIWFGKDEFQSGFEMCMADHPEVEFIEEDGLTYQVRSLVGRTKAVTFFTDDSVLHREVTLEPILVLAQEDVLCFSLRLGLNTNICYPHDARQITPVSPEGPVLMWKWRYAQGDFKYPMSLDGHIFRSSDLKPIIDNRNFANPNSLEEMLVQNTPDRPLMASYPQSHLTGIPVNRVNTTNPNRHSQTYSYSVQELNDRYLQGERLSLASMDFSDIRGAHQELELVFS